MKKFLIVSITTLLLFETSLSKVRYIAHCGMCAPYCKEIEEQNKPDTTEPSVGKKVGKTVEQVVDGAIEKTEYAAASFLVKVIRLMRGILRQTKEGVQYAINSLKNTGDDIEKWAEKKVQEQENSTIEIVIEESPSSPQ